MNERKPTRPKWWNRVPPGEWPHPAAPEDATSGGEVTDGTAGDPAAASTGGAAEDTAPTQAAAPRSADADGDYELERPLAGPGGGDGDFALAPAADGTQDASAAPRTPEEPAVSAPVGPSAEQPRPLHDPDPYNTPPYGEPGPWAPAPPVQHPAVASATAASAPTSSAPYPGMPTAPGSAPVGPPAAESAPQASSAADVPPHGPSAQGGADFHGMPAAPGSAPVGATAAESAPQGPPAADVPPHGSPGRAPADPHGGPVAGAGPWARYDPWARGQAAAPLQQSGAGVLSAEQRHRRVTRALVGGAVVLALASGLLGGLAGAYFERNGGVGTVELPQAGKEPVGRAPDSVAGIAARALPSVVTLHVRGSGEQGTGTGFVLDRLGHILTNNHVVENAASGGDISVTFSGGQTAKARIIGRDTGYDLAVVQVRGVRGLTPLPLGNSDNVQVGDPVVAIGAPFDLANTVTSGIVSAKERPITAGGEKGDGSDVSYVDALQTDAPINPGNSGGPLLDAQGRVVGINSAIRSADTGSDLQTGRAGSIGLGFAIPVNQAKRVAEELIRTGRASHPVIGVTLDMNYTGDGARVNTKGRDGGPPVTPGGPGAKAGIQAGDVITAVNGRRVHSGEELIVKTRAHRPGDRLELTVVHDGRERKVSLVLGSSNGG
ncbi:S1C family serine protease [Streptomyces kebangsaanensis]|uniref:S1C family serine protease n=1 Tax=Streptomyces kebangsaanensis TaxID=864058 RepID=UPI000939B83A|nr:trypsin-like peptidase domain-containing protein [Streptomyces kebangsaanensis]